MHFNYDYELSLLFVFFFFLLLPVLFMNIKSEKHILCIRINFINKLK